MKSTRRELLRNTILFGGTLLVSRSLMACAVDPSNSGEGADETVDATEDGLVTCRPPVISANHGHSLTVSAADVAAQKPKTYSIKGTSSHDHLVTITAAQFAQLGGAHAITVTSTNAAGHTHTVTVTCIATTPATTCSQGASASAISGNHGHSLAVPKADVATAATKTYSIQGSASHAHQVTITAAQFAQLKGGHGISVTSSLALAHAHMLTVTCA